MDNITLFLTIITFCVLLFVIAYIYGKSKAKKIIKYSFLFPLIILLLFVLVLIIGNVFNWFSNFLSHVDWYHLFFMLVICLGALNQSIENSKKDKKNKNINEKENR